MRTFSLLLVCLVVLGVLGYVAAQGGCNTYCANNNECTAPSCSYCYAGLCVTGLPCNSKCVVDTDCNQVGSCPLCTFGFCSSPGGSPPPPPSPPVLNATKACVLNAGYQLCGPPNTVVVEHNWKPETCFGLSNDMDYRGYFALGCVGNSSITTGSSTTHSPPVPDCGWSSGASNSKYSYNKACTAVYNSGTCSGIWDTVIVGYGWTSATCSSFARAYSGYAGTRLVCTFDYFQGGYSIGVSTGAYPPNDCGWAQSDIQAEDSNIIVKQRGVEQQQQDSSSGSKICISYDRTQSMRSTINVPSVWQLNDCYNWAIGTNGQTAIMQVGCIFNTTFSLGATGGGKPNPNCGW